jgi:YVTN family beta-propeller protein
MLTFRNCYHAGILLAVGLLPSASALAQKPFQVEKTWTVGGEGGWDYLTVDTANHRVFLSHMTTVEVVDTNTGKLLGTIKGFTKTHGIVLPPGSKTGYISDGGANNVVAFDTASLAVTAKIPAGQNPDGMVYEKSTNTLWAFNGKSENATVIDVASGKAVGLVALPGKPEFPTTDDKGTVYVNIETKNSIVRLDAKARTVTATWPLAGCESPSGMAYDVEGGRLFSVCDGNKMAITSTKTGKSLATPTIGEDPDAAGYDAAHKLAFSSNGDGTLTVIDASKPNYPVLQNLKTMKGARTMAFDSCNGKIYLVTAKMGPAPAPTAATPKPKPSILPGSFSVLVVGR